MFTKRYIVGLLAIAAVTITLILIVVIPGIVIGEEHCYARLSPIAANSNDSSEILESACFDSFAESIQAATGGRVQLDPSFLPKDLTDELLNSVSTTR